MITSFIKDLFTPIALFIFGKGEYKPYTVLRKGKNYPYKSIEDAEKDEAIIFKYGSFLQTILEFFICGLSAYVFIKILSSLPRK